MSQTLQAHDTTSTIGNEPSLGTLLEQTTIVHTDLSSMASEHAALVASQSHEVHQETAGMLWGLVQRSTEHWDAQSAYMYRDKLRGGRGDRTRQAPGFSTPQDMLLGVSSWKGDAHLFCCTVEPLQVIIVTLILGHDMNDYVPEVQHLPAPTADPGQE